MENKKRTFLNRSEREMCYKYRDILFKCLDECEDDYKKCDSHRQDALKFCPETWLNSFSEKRVSKKVGADSSIGKKSVHYFSGPISTLTNPSKKRSHNQIPTERGYLSKKSIDFDPEDEIMYGDDNEFDKPNENISHRDTTFKKKMNKDESTMLSLSDGMNLGSPRIIMDRKPSDNNAVNKITFSKKTTVNRDPATSNQICGINDSSSECLCERSCLPNMVHNYSPCECVEVIDKLQEENPQKYSKNLHDSEGEPGVPPLLMGSYDDKVDNNKGPSRDYIVPSACDSACAPYHAASQNPCLCDVQGITKSQVAAGADYNNNYGNDILSNGYSSYVQQPFTTPFNQFYSVPFQYNYPLPTTQNTYYSVGYTYPGYDYYNSNYYPSSHPASSPSTYYNSYNSPPSSNVKAHHELSLKDKCKKACFPFVIKSITPCSCDFNSYKSPYENKYDGQNQQYSTANTPSDRSSSKYSDMDPSYDILRGFVNTQNNDDSSIKTGSRISNNMNRRYNSDGDTRHLTPYDSTKRHSYANPRYIGCYKDEKDHGRDLKIDVPIEDLTVDKCVKKCRKKKKRFAGVQYGYLCFCGSRFGRYGRVPDKNCLTPCVGDTTQNCGGPWFNSIFSTDGQLYNETQFSFSTPDSMDEIKAEEEKKKQHKAKVRSQTKKVKSTPFKLAKKRKLHKNSSTVSLHDTKLLKTKHIINKNNKASKKSQNQLDTNDDNEDSDDDNDEDNKNDDKQLKGSNRNVDTTLGEMFGKRHESSGGLIPDSTSAAASDPAINKLKTKLKDFWNKTFEKDKPPTYEVSKLDNDDSQFYKTQDNNPSKLPLNKPDIVNGTKANGSEEEVSTDTKDITDDDDNNDDSVEEAENIIVDDPKSEKDQFKSTTNQGGHQNEKPVLASDDTKNKELNNNSGENGDNDNDNDDDDDVDVTTTPIRSNVNSGKKSDNKQQSKMVNNDNDESEDDSEDNYKV